MNRRSLARTLFVALMVFVLAGCSTPTAPTTEAAPTEAQTAPTTEVNASPATVEALAAAPSEAAAPTEAAPAAGTPKQGGTLRTTMDQDPITSLDPTVPFNNSSIWTILNVYDQFFRAGKDGKTIEPDAAERFEMSADGLTYTLFMRKGLTFSDGTPVTIEDIVFSSERMLKSENWGFLFPAGTTVKAGDQENTVVFTLKTPNAPFINDLAGFWSSIVPKKQVEALGDKFWDQPMGSGPFMIKEWIKGGNITLVRNPYYWDKPYPYLDQVDMNFVPEDNARMAQFQAGELDVALYVPYGQIETVSSVPGVKVQIDPTFALSMIDFNINAKPIDDVRVRQALAHATDKQAIIDAVLYGHGEPANVMWPKVLYWAPEVGGFEYNVDQAKQLLTEAGVNDGFDVTITYIAGDQTREQIATILLDQWSKIGVNAKIEALDSTTFNDRFSQNSLQVALTGYTSDVIDPSELNFIYLCDYAKPRNGGCNDTLDKQAVQADQEMDPAKREQLYHQLMQTANDWLIDLPLYYNPARTGIWDYVKGFQVLPTANFRLWEVWLDK